VSVAQTRLGFADSLRCRLKLLLGNDGKDRDNPDLDWKDAIFHVGILIEFLDCDGESYFDF
jgi:hypothetical protein